MLNKVRTKTKAFTKIQFWFLIDDDVLLFTVQFFISLGHISFSSPTIWSAEVWDSSYIP